MLRCLRGEWPENEAAVEIAALDTNAVGDAYRALVEHACPRAMPLADELWLRVNPRQWALEWNLPLWLGNQFGVAPDVVRQIVLSNVLGLAYVRLADDVADGDVAPVDLPGAGELCDFLLTAAVEPYRHLLPPASPFWPRLDEWLSAWRSVTLEQDADPAPRRAGLARRGAPLKIPALALCLLGDQLAAFAEIERCLDETLSAEVLYDHFCDWREDLAAGRWNAFVGRFGSGAQHPQNRAANQASVLAAHLSSGATQRYFADIHDRLASATGRARALGIAGLADFLAQLTVRLDEQSALLERRYSALGAEAVKLVFGRHPPASTERSRA